MEKTPKLVFLFDGSCDFCTACVELFHVLDRRHHLQCFPFQAPGVPQLYGLTVAQCEQAAWAILPSGQVYRGAQAINMALDTIIGFPLSQKICYFPGMRWLEDRVYAWVAKHRRWFPGIQPYCQRPDSTCGK